MDVVHRVRAVGPIQISRIAIVDMQIDEMELERDLRSVGMEMVFDSQQQEWTAQFPNLSKK